MEEHPDMWAGTKEAFGLQLVLLMEFYQIEDPATAVSSSRAMRELFGPGNQVDNRQPLEREWARHGIQLIRMLLDVPG